jgi:hypothetical protein
MIKPAAGWGSIYEDPRDRQTRDVQPRRRIWQAERNPGLLAADIPYARRSPVLIPFPYVPVRSLPNAGERRSVSILTDARRAVPTWMS